MKGRLAPYSPAARLGLGRPAVVLSVVLHVAAFVITLGVPRLLASSSKAPPVYVVDLVTFGGGAAGPPAPPSAPPAPANPPKAAPPAPPVKTEKKAPQKAIVIPERGAKKTPPKETKKPEKKPEPPAEETKETEAAEAAGQPEAQPAAAAPAPGTAKGPGAPAGTGTGTGAGGTGNGVGGDAYNFYLALLDRSIKGAWKRPLYGGSDVLSATVRLEISRSGRVVKLDLLTSSGLDALDRSVLKAVRDAEPFPPLPTDVTLDTLPVQIVFELNPQASGAGGPRE